MATSSPPPSPRESGTRDPPAAAPVNIKSDQITSHHIASHHTTPDQTRERDGSPPSYEAHPHGVLVGVVPLEQLKDDHGVEVRVHRAPGAGRHAERRHRVVVAGVDPDARLLGALLRAAHLVEHVLHQRAWRRGGAGRGGRAERKASA